ncbi:Sapep family Mn(2+)-dependent dipeptidase [Sporosarcina sp. SAFN-015]|uniref:Sapep family Mn(2+)-dependent dipeptidase n=1 Tax=Sporosarcina sp. SAFN-015 TaxID=3387274 RepID=UPI003F7E8DF3
MDWIGLANAKREQIINETIALIKIDSTEDKSTADESINAPYGKGPREALNLFLAQSSRKGFTTVDFNGHVIRVEYGEGDEIVGILAHLDVVPAGEGWNTNPFEGVIENGRIHGRGSIDNKGPAVAVLAAMEIVRSIIDEPKRKVHFILGCNEETGMGCLKYYAEKVNEHPTFGMTPDNSFPVVYGEKGIMQFIIKGSHYSVIKKLNAGLRGNIVPNRASALVDVSGKDQASIIKSFMAYNERNRTSGKISYDGTLATVSLEGVSTHAQMPMFGINAITHLLDWIGQEFNDKFAIEITDLCKEWDGSGFGVNYYDKYFKNLTMNLGVININETDFDLLIDMRYPKSINQEELIRKLRTKVSIDRSWMFEITSNTLPLFVDPNSEFVKTLERIYREITGDTTTPLQTTGGGTYARIFKNHVAYGPLPPEGTVELPKGVGTLHQANEAIEIEQLVNLCAIYAKAIYEFLSSAEDVI